MINYKRHLINSESTIREALIRLDELGIDSIVFVVDKNERLVASLTDGDTRRGLLKGFSLDDSIDSISYKHPRYIRKGDRDISRVIEYRENNFRILPVIDNEDKVINVINFRTTKSYLPVDAVIMAGGMGVRLKPLTDTVPKPMLKVGDRPIIEHNLGRLALYGIDDFWISLKYLGEQIRDYFGTGEDRSVNIHYVWEEQPLGTIGAVSKIENFEHEYVLVTNSDLITNLDYEHFFLEFIKEDADLSVLSIPYKVNIPYAVLETKKNGRIISFKEKPTYNYYSNGGIYLMKKSVLEFLPKHGFYNATDLMEKLISLDKKVIAYPLTGYWLDVGRHEDFEKAQKDIKHINF